MPVKLAPHQLEFYRELMAPFAAHELSHKPARGGGRPLTWVDKRAIENRLDTVCGPHGWRPKYEETSRGMKCTLWLYVPTAHPDQWIWHDKDDGAGFEGMESNDDDTKSGYTNAFRRAAQDAWGIGRQYYDKGVPGFMDAGRARNLPPAIGDGSNPQPYPSPVTHDFRPGAYPAPTQAPPQNGTNPSNFRIPHPGKQVYAWMKEMEKHFQTKLFHGMTGEGEKRGWGKQMGDWTKEQVDIICIGTIEFIKSLPNYKGEFDELEIPEAKPISDIRHQLLNMITALVARQSGVQTPTTQQVKDFYQAAAETLSPGEIIEPLSRLQDRDLLRRMIEFIQEQIDALNDPEARPANSEEIPF